MFERFTDRARRVVVLAQEEARMLRHNYIGTEHLLLGLIAEGTGVGAVVLQRLDIDLVRLDPQVTAIIGPSNADIPQGHIPFTPRSKHVLELALREALTLHHNYIGTEHILLGLLRESEGVGAQVLIRCGAALETVRQTTIDVLASYSFGSAAPHAQPTAQDRYSPGLRAALGHATATAADAIAVGTQHLLSVFAERSDLAASRVLTAGGFDPSKLATPIAHADVADTLDETASQWGMRVTAVETTDEGIVIAMKDAELQARVRSAIDAGNGAAVEAAIGEALRQLRTTLPPADPAARETAEEHHEDAGGD